MNAPKFSGLGMISCLLLLPVAGLAQQSGGSITGVVRDISGAVLPGVTVTVSSPALIEGSRVAVCDGQGLYRIIDLRPGIYSVAFELAGFSPFKVDGLELTTGFTATVNADLKVGSLQETITVSGQAPVVDTQNIRQQTQFSSDALQSLPGSGRLRRGRCRFHRTAARYARGALPCG